MNFFEKRRWAKLLKGCHYDFVAEKLGTAADGGIIPKKLAALLDAYCSNPCLETAVELIKYDLYNKEKAEDEKFLNLFMLASDMGREEFCKYFEKLVFSLYGMKKSENDFISEDEF